MPILVIFGQNAKIRKLVPRTPKINFFSKILKLSESLSPYLFRKVSTTSLAALTLQLLSFYQHLALWAHCAVGLFI